MKITSLTIPGSLRHVVPFLSVLFLPPSAYTQTIGACEPTGADTTYLPATLPTFPRQPTALYKVTRVVGPGLTSEYPAPDGLTITPANLDLYVANGVLKQNASIQAQSRMILGAPFWQLVNTIPGVTSARVRATYRFYLNRSQQTPQLLGTVRRDVLVNSANPLGLNAGQKTNCFTFPARYLRFARLLRTIPSNATPEYPCPPDFKAQVVTTGPTPDRTCPGINELSVEISGPTIDIFGVDGETLTGTNLGLTYATTLETAQTHVSVSAAGGILAFEAMSPVILLHGIRAGQTHPLGTDGAIRRDRDWFSSYDYTPSTLAVPNLDTSAANWFKEPFRLAKIPHLSAPFNDTRYDAVRTASRGPGIAVADAVEAFGSAYAHLVGHSGGGIWAKAIVEAQNGSTPPVRLTAFRVRSIITVNTPHLGSMNADTLCAFNSLCPNRPPGGILIPQDIRDYFLDRPSLYSELMPDLRVADATALAQRRLPNSVQFAPSFIVGSRRHQMSYYAFGTDANANDSCASGPSNGPIPVNTPPPSVSPCSISNLPTITDFQQSATVLNPPDESIGYEPPDPDVPSNIGEYLLGVGQSLYRKLFRYDEFRLQPCTALPPDYHFITRRPLCAVYFPSADSARNLNDFNVLKRSQMPDPSQYQFLTLDARRANHTTTGRRTHGEIVREKIFEIERTFRILPLE
jgi:pimeloyl-ACP methyl ester carboxylesterase